MRDDDARIRIAAEETNECGMAKVHAFKALRAVDLSEEFKLEEERLELGAGETPFDAADEAGEMQTPRMFRRGLEEAGKSRLKIGRAADVGLGAGVGPIESKNRRRSWKLSERGFGVGRVKGSGFPSRGMNFI
jgi:hypothetical protein